MRKTGGGSIIMMSSLAGLRGAAGLSGYCATKGGVRLFAKAIAMECAHGRRHPRQFGASRHHRHADLGQDPD
jgi:NAD(P)-dependent dehydrogenase (short-subunit alcohol dehydrogenase family)